MKTITLADLRKVLHDEKAEVLEGFLPIQVTINGTPWAVLDKFENSIPLTDIHPRMVIKLRALERMARAGMPKVEKVDVKALKEDSPIQ